MDTHARGAQKISSSALSLATHSRTACDACHSASENKVCFSAGSYTLGLTILRESHLKLTIPIRTGI